MNKTYNDFKREAIEDFTERFSTPANRPPIPFHSVTQHNIQSFLTETLDNLLNEVERMMVPKLSNIRNGWSGAESGPCCEKCAMRSEHLDGRGNALKSVVGCRNPFQLESTCSCHLQPRVNSVLEAFKKFRNQEHVCRDEGRGWCSCGKCLLMESDQESV